MSSTVRFRCPVVRVLLAAISLLALSTVVAAEAKQACAVGATPWLSLTIRAGTAISVKDREISVRVHDNGCVELHRPSFYRQPGDYRLALTATELAELRAQADPAKLRGFDAAKLRAEIAEVQQVGAKSGSGGAEAFAVLDGDLIALEWRDGGKRSAAAWPAVHEYAEHYPEIGALQSFSAVAKAVQALLARDGAIAVAGAAP